VNYRVHLDGISRSDTLIVEITHENGSFKRSYTFRGSDVLMKKSLSFTVVNEGKRDKIVWRSTQPMRGV
jgi:hypothetical protein